MHSRQNARTIIFALPEEYAHTITAIKYSLDLLRKGSIGKTGSWMREKVGRQWSKKWLNPESTWLALGVPRILGSAHPVPLVAHMRSCCNLIAASTLWVPVFRVAPWHLPALYGSVGIYSISTLHVSMLRWVLASLPSATAWCKWQKLWNIIVLWTLQLYWLVVPSVKFISCSANQTTF
jgi:hypothetical protein